MRIILVSCLFALYLFESALMPWVFPHGWLDVVALRFVLVGILFIGMFQSRQSGLLYGLLFGFLMDVLHFVHMLGLYTFLFGLAGYMVGLFSRRFSLQFAPSVVLIAAVLFVFELCVYFIYLFYETIDITLADALIRNMIPSVIINTLFAAAIYQGAERLFLSMQNFGREEG